MFSWEISQIIQGSNFKEHLRVAGSETIRESSRNSSFSTEVIILVVMKNFKKFGYQLFLK